MASAWDTLLIFIPQDSTQTSPPQRSPPSLPAQSLTVPLPPLYILFWTLSSLGNSFVLHLLVSCLPTPPGCRPCWGGYQVSLSHFSSQPCPWKESGSWTSLLPQALEVTSSTDPGPSPAALESGNETKTSQPGSFSGTGRGILSRCLGARHQRHWSEECAAQARLHPAEPMPVAS